MSLNPSFEPALAPIAFYVHHHGSGHATRCKQIAACWPDDSPVHVFTSAPRYFEGWGGGTVHKLDMDTEEGRDPARDMLDGQVLHYAPVGLRNVSRRMATIATFIAERNPKLFIVDLSCEVALFARLCGAKVALVRLHGYREDPAHVAAFQLSDVLLAPFPPCLEDEHTAAWVRDKTIYLGLFSRYDRRVESTEECRAAIGAPGKTLVTVVNGSGGGHRKVDHWSAIARANPEYHFYLLGHLDQTPNDQLNLTLVGYVENTYTYLRAADIIVGSGGTNTMSEVAAAGGRYLSLPEPRPFNEQVYKMQALERYGLTRILPNELAPKEWSKWFRRARDLQPGRWRKLRYSADLQSAIDTLAQRCSGEGVGATVRVDDLLGG